MPWTCFLVTEIPGEEFLFDVPGEGMRTFSMLQPGAMWFDNGDKDDLVVKLPSGSEWYIDRGRLINEQTDRIGKPRLPQWTRTGEPPNVTASPSINHVGQYHGWLQNGVLSDDCEGRVFA